VARITGERRDIVTRRPTGPVRVFIATQGTPWADGGPLMTQSQRARKLAAGNGYRNVSLTVLKDKRHGPLPDEVLEFISSLMKK
jgi:hypothetical protein